jgi:undecaprenyl-diphosphatase
MLVVATLPAGFFGLIAKPVIEQAFNSIPATGIALLFTGALLIISERVGHRDRQYEKISWLDALIIGAFQMLAVFPGVSRSGSTITGGMFRHLKRADAARFSFLMSVPIMLAAGLISGIDLIQTPNVDGFLLPLAVGFVTAAVVGYFSIRWLLNFLTKYPLHWFAGYVIALGLITLSTF